MPFFRKREPSDDPINQWMAANPGKAYAAVVVFVPLFFFSAMFATRGFDELRLEHGGRETLAVVDLIDPTQHGGHLYVHYPANGREYTGQMGMPGGVVFPISVGDTVRVTYLPSDPYVMHGGPRPRGVLRDLAGTSGIIGLFAGAFYFLPVYWLPKRRLQATRG